MPNYLDKYNITGNGEALREMAAGSITGSYQNIGAAFGRRVASLILSGDLNGDVYIRVATDVVIRLPASAGLALNNVQLDCCIPKGTFCEIKQGHTAPTTGYLTVTPIYRS